MDQREHQTENGEAILRQSEQNYELPSRSTHIFRRYVIDGMTKVPHQHRMSVLEDLGNLGITLDRSIASRGFIRWGYKTLGLADTVRGMLRTRCDTLGKIVRLTGKSVTVLQPQ